MNTERPIIRTTIGSLIECWECRIPNTISDDTYDKTTDKHICVECWEFLDVGVLIPNNRLVNEDFLRINPQAVLVYDDDLERTRGTRCHPILNEPNTFGFITKIKPYITSDAYFTPENYFLAFHTQLQRLDNAIRKNQHLHFYIEKIGSGDANRFGIFEALIKPEIEILKDHKNVTFLW